MLACSVGQYTQSYFTPVTWSDGSCFTRSPGDSVPHPGVEHESLCHEWYQLHTTLPECIVRVEHAFDDPDRRPFTELQISHCVRAGTRLREAAYVSRCGSGRIGCSLLSHVTYLPRPVWNQKCGLAGVFTVFEPDPSKSCLDNPNLMLTSREDDRCAANRAPSCTGQRVEQGDGELSNDSAG